MKRNSRRKHEFKLHKTLPEKKKKIKETQMHTEQVDSGSNGLVKF